jgi:AraC-like DNA-binding protein
MKPERSPKNTVAIWSDAALETTEFLHADYRQMRFAPHVHAGFAIGVIESGGQWFRPAKRDAVVMPEGTLCVINPWTLHDGHGADQRGWRYRMFYPSETVVARALADCADGGLAVVGHFEEHVIHDAVLYRKFVLLHEASRVHQPLLERQSLQLLFLKQLFTRHARGVVPAEPVACSTAAARVREYLHAHWCDKISTEDLARLAGVSETHVIRSFTRWVGMPPHAYLLGVKVEKAKALLLRGTPLSEVALSAGFADQSHFTRHFKRTTGHTPGQYACAARG